MNYRDIAQEAVDNRYCHQDIDELAELLRVIKELDPKIYMEIGTYYGGGMWAIRQVLPDSLLVGVDNYSLDTTINTVEWVRKQEIGMPYTIFNADSQRSETLEILKEYFDHTGSNPVEFLFIDGNHNYDYVKTDFNLYSCLVVEGGTIGFHDINPPDDARNARDLWAEIKGNYESQEIILAPGQWCGVGLIKWS